MPVRSGLKLTYEDFVLFPEDGKRHEIVDGEHCVTPSPNTRHQQISGNIFGLLWVYLRAHAAGRVFQAPYDVVLSPVDVIEPDVIYVSNERASIVTPANIQGSPDLVVEITSPSTRARDETMKRRLYERSDVLEYWVVDPEIDVVRVYRRAGDDAGTRPAGRPFDRPQELSREAGDELTSPLLPDVSLPLDEIFRA
jgi:Uma2 family endonuclease